MTNKERIHRVLEGKTIDRMPVTVLYNQLYYLDHFSELTGKEQWELHKWLDSSPKDHLEIYEEMISKTPFDILQSQGAPSRYSRENVEFVVKDGKPFRHDKREDKYTPVVTETVSGHATDYRSNQTQYIFDKSDVAKHFRLYKAEDMIANGSNDYLDAVIAKLGKDHFILSGGVVGTLYLCHSYVGLTNLYAMLIEKPDLIEYLSKKLLKQNIETIRFYANSGGDAIYIDDAMTTSDMISVKHYERFCLPYMREMVNEIHRLGQKAIIIYFGGIADRLEQIVSIGADGLSMETSMKNYVNDIDEIADKIGDRITLFGNIDPVGVLQNGTDTELELEITRQAMAGRKCRGFIMCTGSPITPSTSLARIQKFIELGRKS
jgi:uroporphyrinogen decarboxylase